MSARVNVEDVRAYEARRAEVLRRDAVAAAQLDALNQRWQEAVAGIAHWRDLVEIGTAPRRFSSLDEFAATVPPLTKADLQRGGVSHARPAADFHRITGGSTAQPLQMPAWKSELDETRLDPWLGRSWLGVEPRDRMFLFWGHAHLLGSGWRGRLNGLLRIAKDRIQGYERVSCYDLTEPRLREVGAMLLASSARFIVGYSHALDALARANADRAAEFKARRFKGVIAAAEALPMHDSRSVIEGTFGTTLTMEYGSVETNLIAHSAPDGLFHVFWDHYLLEYRPVEAASDISEVLVTALYPRCTPLFRYRIGDRFRLGSGRRSGISVLSFAEVGGRSNQFVEVPGGLRLHSEVVSHIVRDSPHVAAYQFVCAPDRVYLDVVPKAGWDRSFEPGILGKAARIDPRLAAALEIRPVDRLRKSVAGKLPMVVRLSADGLEPSTAGSQGAVA